ncbi:hypothetical protein BJ875DRAFT_438500 [Amylocarpus encephaloides]|uniref:Uncharacterized protein n=1 Tax=Amylocarpus encephaloides TaxID=45428 RepID=A0A9P7YPB1_9HELO|nr:hypothetical protein BJ875DRAFT_438500 [Amylocarpus encephaloides]
MQYGMYRPDRRQTWMLFALFLVLQIAVSVIPAIPGYPSNTSARNWGILIFTVAGNLLAVLTASLSSAREEKFQGRLNSKDSYVITRGNGHKYVFIILPDTLQRKLRDLDEEEQYMDGQPLSSLPHLEDLANPVHRASTITRYTSIFYALCWIVLLYAIGGLEDDAWCLLIVGLLGMAHNMIVAGSSRSPEAHGIALEKIGGVEHPQDESTDVDLGYLKDLLSNPLEGESRKLVELGRKSRAGERPKVMDVLYALERKFPGTGHSLRPLFFPGRPRKWEEDKWKKAEYSLDTIDTRLERRRNRWYTSEELILPHLMRPPPVNT